MGVGPHGLDAKTGSIPTTIFNIIILPLNMPFSSQNLEDRIDSALKVYHASEKPVIPVMAREFDILYYTLRGRINGRKSLTGRPGTNKALGIEQEGALIHWIDTLNTANAPPTADMIQKCALQILHRQDLDLDLGKNWAYRFIKRLPNKYAYIKQKPMEKDRLQAVTPGHLTTWYTRLGSTIQRLQIGSKNIYNFDESGFKIGEGKARKVETTKAGQSASIGTGGPSESLTSIECIAADGWVMPPWFLVKGEFHMENWYRTTNLPNDYWITPTPNGWTDDITAFQWLQSFEEITKNRCTKTGFRLLMDNHGSHLTFEFVNFCEDHQIIPYCFIPHTTHICQPLDDVPFQVLNIIFVRIIMI